MSGTMPSEILFYAILACCTRIAPFSTWEKITDPTNFLDRGRVTYVFQSELFLFLFSFNKKQVYSFAKPGTNWVCFQKRPNKPKVCICILHDRFLSECVWKEKKNTKNRVKLDCTFFPFKLLKHLLFHILPVFEQLET